MDNYEKYRDSKIIKSAEVEMKKCRHPYVGTEHLLLALLKEDEISDICNKYNLTYDNFKKSLLNVVGKSSMETSFVLHTPLLKMIVLDTIEDFGELNSKGLLLSMLENSDGIAIRILLNMGISLDKLYNDLKNIENDSIEFGNNLNDSVDMKEIVYGREKELELLIETLLRKNKSNPILVGPAGVGKTAIVYELARRINKGLVPNRLKTKKIIQIEMCDLVAGTKYRGEFEEKIKKIIDVCKDNRDIILFIDEIHTIIHAGGSEGAIDAANILKPYLSNGSISVIGATTIYEYNKFIKKDKALDRRFQMISIKEPSLLETIEIVNKSKKVYENFYGIKITKNNVKDIVYLSDKYIKHKKNPDKSFEVLDLLCSKLLLKEKLNILKEDIISILNEISNINSNVIDYDLLLNRLKEQIIGQDGALENIVNCLKNNIESLGMLFYGSSGVGKTETINVLSKELGYNLIKLDMSEYSNEMSINKLIGAPIGYQGCDDEFILESLRFEPKSIVVLDNFEKGSKRIVNMFLNALDEGFLTDAKGEIIDFSHAIIIFTTNVMKNVGVGFSNNNSKNNNDIINKINEVIYFNDVDEFMVREYISKNNYQNKDVLINCDYKNQGFRAINKLIKSKNKS